MKFTDDGKPLYEYFDYRIVCCPKCSKAVDFYDGKVTCIHCGHHKDFKSGKTGAEMFRATLQLDHFLQIPCCGDVLWAVNLEHLDFLESYVGAGLRGRIPNINRSMASRLPQWIKAAKNRDEILRSISRLREKLRDSGYRPRKASAGG